MIKVYIVDDHSIVVDGIKRMLDSEVDIFISGSSCNGVDALKWLVKNDFDVVIMDISMPLISGVDTFKKLMKEKPASKVLFFSMHPADQYIVELMKIGAKGYIKKDSSAADIAAAVKKIHSGRRYIPDYLSDAMFDMDEHVNSAVSQREVDVIRLLATGKTNIEISQALFISPKTVSTHKANLMKKLKLKNNTDIYRYAISNGLISEDFSLDIVGK